MATTRKQKSKMTNISVWSDFVVGSIGTQEVKKDWEGNDGILDTLRLCFL